MNRLQDRLRRLTKSRANDEESAVQVPAPDDGWAKLQATPVENEAGSFVRRKIIYSRSDRHGDFAFDDLLTGARALSALTAGDAGVTPDNLLFLDTETTGLGVGAGNVPFLIGFGYFKADEFVIEQCLMRNPGDEPAMLLHLQRVIERYSYLVTYNGRTFDWPVLKNRFIMNRLEMSDAHLTHLDFLYPSRRLWRRLLPSCSLGTVEEDRLGVIREDDIPGSMAPTLYFQFLSSGDADHLEGVFRHNEADVLSLAGLAAWFAGVLQGRIGLSGMESEEVLRLGLWFDKLNRPGLADEAYAELLRRPLAAIRDQLLTLAGVLKKRGRFKEAVPLWQEAASQGVRQCDPYVELAMYYEHKTKEIERALAYAEQAKAVLWRRRSLQRQMSGKEREAVAELDRRIARLRRKLAASANERCASQLYAGDLFADN